MWAIAMSADNMGLTRTYALLGPRREAIECFVSFYVELEDLIFRRNFYEIVFKRERLERRR
jgi:hypothetical protein